MKEVKITLKEPSTLKDEVISGKNIDSLSKETDALKDIKEIKRSLK